MIDTRCFVKTDSLCVDKWYENDKMAAMKRITLNPPSKVSIELNKAMKLLCMVYNYFVLMLFISMPYAWCLYCA